MAAAAEYQYAHALTLKPVGGDIYSATRDLSMPAAVTTLGALFVGRIKSMSPIEEGGAEEFHGVDLGARVVVVLDNSDDTFDSTSDWRGVEATIEHYDILNDTAVEDFFGVVKRANFGIGQVTMTLGTLKDELLSSLIPTQVIEPTGVFVSSADAGKAFPVPFGINVPVRPVSAKTDTSNDPGGIDYILGFEMTGGGIKVGDVFLDSDQEIAGLEPIGTFVLMPGSPTFFDADEFSVTGNLEYTYQVGMPLIITHGGGPTVDRAVVKAYDTVNDRVQIEAGVTLTSPITSVTSAGDYLVLPSGYQGVGLRDPVTGAASAKSGDFNAIRLYAHDGATLITEVSNTLFDMSNPVEAVKELLTNAIWGLASVGGPANADTAAFNAAASALESRGFGGVANNGDGVAGALAFDKAQRQAGQVLNELLSFLGLRVFLNSSGEWDIEDDATAPAAATRTFGLGPGTAQNIKRVDSYGNVEAGRAVKAFKLHWGVLGRARSAQSKFETADFTQSSVAAVSAFGQVREDVSSWIRTTAIAEKVTWYRAQRLKAADEPLAITVGPEGRDVVRRERVTIDIPALGINKTEWQVMQLSRRLGETGLVLVPYLASIYANPSGGDVTSTLAPSLTQERSAPNGGKNLAPNAGWAAPLFVAQLGQTSTHRMPHGWDIIYDVGDDVSLVTWNRSVATALDTFSGNYLEITVDTAWDPATPQPFGVATVEFVSVGKSKLLMFSLYCDRDDLLLEVTEVYSSSSSKFVPLIKDDTDTNPLGWARYYARYRTRPSAKSVQAIWAFGGTGVFKMEAPGINDVGKFARKPPPWAVDRPEPRTHRTTIGKSASGGSKVTFTGAFKSGWYVQGVTTILASDLVFGGGGTKWRIGTNLTQNAWGEDITNATENDETTSDDFKVKNEMHFAADTDLVIECTDGTLTSGTFAVSIEYTTRQVASLT